jgi:DNA-binding NarL/FixJ family response regulator
MDPCALVVEDRPDSRTFLAAIVRRAFPRIAVHAAADLRSARAELAGVSQFRLALVDLDLPDGSGIELIREMQSSHPETPAIVTTVYSDDDSLFSAIAAGAQGYLLKGQPPELLQNHLQRLDEGVLPLSPSIARRMLGYFRERGHAPPSQAQQVALSPRETDVLTCIGRGLRVAETAQRLGLAESTVAGYVKTLYQKLNISSRAEAALEAVRRGLA